MKTQECWSSLLLVANTSLLEDGLLRRMIRFRSVWGWFSHSSVVLRHGCWNWCSMQLNNLSARQKNVTFLFNVIHSALGAKERLVVASSVHLSWGWVERGIKAAGGFNLACSTEFMLPLDSSLNFLARILSALCVDRVFELTVSLRSWLCLAKTSLDLLRSWSSWWWFRWDTSRCEDNCSWIPTIYSYEQSFVAVSKRVDASLTAWILSVSSVWYDVCLNKLFANFSVLDTQHFF